MTTSIPETVDPIVGQAAAVAAARARGSGVIISLLTSVDQLESAELLINKTWPAEVTISILRAFRKAGNFVSGAYLGDRLVGACVAFFGANGPSELHSHLAVIDEHHRTAGIGAALKLHQRAWALEHGVSRIYWTYDPLQRRNAHVNLNKLGARPVEYLENFYGDHGDGASNPFPTDRLMVEWDLQSDRVALACHGRSDSPDLSELRRSGCATLLAMDSRGAPRDGPDRGEPIALVGTPTDASSLRVRDRALALEWLTRVRHHLRTALANGAQVSAFAREGFYVIERGSAQEVNALRGTGGSVWRT